MPHAGCTQRMHHGGMSQHLTSASASRGRSGAQQGASVGTSTDANIGTSTSACVGAPIGTATGLAQPSDKRTVKAAIGLRLHWPSALLTLAVFALEVFIALRVRDAFVRPYLGDVLVVVLMYLAFKTVLRAPATWLAGAALAIACVIEELQALSLVDVLGIENRVLRVALGSTFSWADMLCYAAGAALVLMVERWAARRASPQA